MREPSDTDFRLEVPNQGEFVFGRRTMRDRFRIGAMVNRLTEGTTDDESAFAMVAEAYATLSVMMVEGPKEFTKLLDMDAEADDSADEPVLSVYFAYRRKEDELRQAASKSGEGEREGASDDAGVVVQESLSTSAD